MVNKRDQSVLQRCIPYKPHNRTAHRKTGIYRCVFGRWGIQKRAEGLLSAPRGKQPDGHDVPCCEYETELQFCTCFLCSQGSRNLQDVSYRKLHIRVSPYFYSLLAKASFLWYLAKHVVWMSFRSRCPVMQNSLTGHGPQMERQLDFCIGDNQWCYHGVTFPSNTSRSCVHNSATEDICFRHWNVQNRLNTPVPWMPLSIKHKESKIFHI